MRTCLHTSLALKFPFFHSLCIGYVERFRCRIECDHSAVWASRRRKTSSGAECLYVIHIVWLLGEKEQHQKWGQPVLVEPREPSSYLSSLSLKVALSRGEDGWRALYCEWVKPLAMQEETVLGFSPLLALWKQDLEVSQRSVWGVTVLTFPCTWP